jgi:cytochrome c553
MMKLQMMLVLAVSLVAAAHASIPDGDPDAGARKNAMCIGCHGIVGFKTGFPEVYRVPKLYGQNGKYIANALGEYKRGERNHPSMRAIAQTLTDQDMADLGAYFESAVAGQSLQGAGHLSSEATQGRSLVARGGCQACHGENFTKPIDASFPKLAGQNGDYLYAALRAYKVGENPREKPWIGRANPVMGGMTAQFTDEQLQALADYLASLPGNLETLQRSRFH